MRFAKAQEIGGWRVAVFVRRATDDCGYEWSYQARRGKARAGATGHTYGSRGDAIADAFKDAEAWIARLPGFGECAGAA